MWFCPWTLWLQLLLLQANKANQAVPHQEHRRGAHLPYAGCKASRWINHLSPWNMASATPDLCYLPSHRASSPFDWYKIILLGEQRHVCEKLAQGCYLAVLWLKSHTCNLRVTSLACYTHTTKPCRLTPSHLLRRPRNFTYWHPVCHTMWACT